MGWWMMVGGLSTVRVRGLLSPPLGGPLVGSLPLGPPFRSPLDPRTPSNLHVLCVLERLGAVRQGWMDRA